MLSVAVGDIGGKWRGNKLQLVMETINFIRALVMPHAVQNFTFIFSYKKFNENSTLESSISLQ